MHVVYGEQVSAAARAGSLLELPPGRECPFALDAEARCATDRRADAPPMIEIQKCGDAALLFAALERTRAERSARGRPPPGRGHDIEAVGVPRQALQRRREDRRPTLGGGRPRSCRWRRRSRSPRRRNRRPAGGTRRCRSRCRARACPSRSRSRPPPHSAPEPRFTRRAAPSPPLARPTAARGAPRSWVRPRSARGPHGLRRAGGPEEGRVVAGELREAAGLAPGEGAHAVGGLLEGPCRAIAKSG